MGEVDSSFLVFELIYFPKVMLTVGGFNEDTYCSRFV